QVEDAHLIRSVKAVCWIAEERGRYVVGIAAAREHVPDGTYQMGIFDLHDANADDQRAFRQDKLASKIIGIEAADWRRRAGQGNSAAMAWLAEVERSKNPATVGPSASFAAAP